METIDGERGPGHVILAGIAHVLKVMVLGGMKMIRLSAGHQVVVFQIFGGELIQGLPTELVIAPGQPFQSHCAIRPRVQWQGCWGSRGLQVSLAGRGKSYVLKRIEPRFGFKPTFESQTTFL